MTDFLLNTVIGNILLGLIVVFITWLIQKYTSLMAWEYHLKDKDSVLFPEKLGFRKDHTGQYCRRGMYRGDTKEVPEENMNFEIGRGYKFFKNKMVRQKVCVYRRGHKKKFKAYFMFPI